MLRLSRLAVVVLLALPAQPRNASTLLRHFTDQQQQRADHRVIFISIGKQQIPHQLMNAGGQDLPVVSRPISFSTLFAFIAQAYAQLGGSNKQVDNPA